MPPPRSVPGELGFRFILDLDPPSSSSEPSTPRPNSNPSTPNSSCSFSSLIPTRFSTPRLTIDDYRHGTQVLSYINSSGSRSSFLREGIKHHVRKSECPLTEVVLQKQRISEMPASK